MNAAAIDALIPRIPQLSPGCVVRAAPEAPAGVVEVSVEIASGWSTACPEERAGYAQALRQLIETELGLRVVVRVEEVGTLDRPKS